MSRYHFALHPSRLTLERSQGRAFRRSEVLLGATEERRSNETCVAFPALAGDRRHVGHTGDNLVRTAAQLRQARPSIGTRSDHLRGQASDPAARLVQRQRPLTWARRLTALTVITVAPVKAKDPPPRTRRCDTNACCSCASGLSVRGGRIHRGGAPPVVGIVNPDRNCAVHGLVRRWPQPSSRRWRLRTELATAEIAICPSVRYGAATSARALSSLVHLSDHGKTTRTGVSRSGPSGTPSPIWPSEPRPQQ